MPIRHHGSGGFASKFIHSSGVSSATHLWLLAQKERCVVTAFSFRTIRVIYLVCIACHLPHAKPTGGFFHVRVRPCPGAPLMSAALESRTSPQSSFVSAHEPLRPLAHPTAWSRPSHLAPCRRWPPNGRLPSVPPPINTTVRILWSVLTHSGARGRIGRVS